MWKKLKKYDQKMGWGHGRGQWDGVRYRLENQAEVLPYESLAFAHADERVPHATAGPDGAEVLIMQYPKTDPALLDGAPAPYSMDGR